MALISQSQKNMAIIDEGRASRQLSAEFGIRIDERIYALCTNANGLLKIGQLTPDKSHSIMSGICELLNLLDSWKSEIRAADAASKQEFKDG